MTKLKKFDPQNRKKDMNHEELREFRVRNKPIPKERSGANRQRFMNMVIDDEDESSDDFYTQTN